MSIILYTGLALFLGMMAVAVFGMVEFFTSVLINANAKDWTGLIAIIGGFFFLGYLFVKGARNRIIMTEAEIFVPEYWGGKDNKIQYETHIPYDEIRNIFMVVSNKNSLGKKARWVFTPMPYIVFECENDKQKAINIFYYSKKQAIKIIDEAIRRAIATGNVFVTKTGAELLSDFLEHIKKKN